MDTNTPVWFITAASSGFGRYVALEALSRGHKVVATARSTSRLTELAEKGAFTIALDVTWPLDEIVKVAKTANDKYGYINHVINAAGYVFVGAVEEST
jgi:NADP-dependent 3-hydroxy acid dehydrogenase YdfG